MCEHHAAAKRTVKVAFHQRPEPGYIKHKNFPGLTAIVTAETVVKRGEEDNHSVKNWERQPELHGKELAASAINPWCPLEEGKQNEQGIKEGSSKHLILWTDPVQGLNKECRDPFAWWSISSPSDGREAHFSF